MTDQIEVNVDPIVAQSLAGVPEFYDLPDELRETIEAATMLAERMFWLRATQVDDTTSTRCLLRRAVYAEQRCWEMENRAAEISLIAQGMKERIQQLEKDIATVAGHTG